MSTKQLNFKALPVIAAADGATSPALTASDKGALAFSTTIGKALMWDGTKWSSSGLKGDTGATGAVSAADQTKLNGIQAGATANATDAQLRDRSTHTGAQAIATVTGLQSMLDGKSSTTHTHANASTTVAGFMSDADKTKLDGIATGANNFTYAHPANHPASVITQDASNRFVTDTEKAAWNAKIGSVKTINGQSIVGGGDLVISAGAVSADNVTETANRVFITPQQKQAFSNAVHYETGYVPKNQFKTINGQAIYDQWGGDLTVSGSPDFTSSKNITIGGKNLAGVMQNAVYVGFGGGQTITNPNTDPMRGGGGTIYTAEESTAVGKNALFMNQSGNFNTAVGSRALSFNDHGSHNTAIGARTLASNNSGTHNTAIGAHALFRNTWGMENVAIGKDALFRNEGGSQNIAIGAGTLYSNTSGNFNVAIGTAALQSNTVDSNTAIGNYALSSNTNGVGNVAIGNNAIQKGCQSAPFSAAGIINGGTGYTNGNYENINLTVQTASSTLGSVVVLPKVFIRVVGGAITDVQSAYGVLNWGYPLDESIVFTVNSALIGGTGSGFQVRCSAPFIAKHNTGVGTTALKNLISGAGNICIGSETSIGTYAPAFDVVAENNRIVMGHTSVTNAYIKVAWTVVSDARDKTNFKAIPHGLDFVKRLKPTAYQFRTSRESEETNGGVRYGFKAQDIAAIEPEAVIVDTTNSNKLYYNESNLIPILVKAIQELTAKVERLENANSNT